MRPPRPTGLRWAAAAAVALVVAGCSWREVVSLGSGADDRPLLEVTDVGVLTRVTFGPNFTWVPAKDDGFGTFGPATLELDGVRELVVPAGTRAGGICLVVNEFVVDRYLPEVGFDVEGGGTDLFVDQLDADPCVLLVEADGEEVTAFDATGFDAAGNIDVGGVREVRADGTALAGAGWTRQWWPVADAVDVVGCEDRVDTVATAVAAPGALVLGGVDPDTLDLVTAECVYG